VDYKAQYLLRFCKWGSKLSELECGVNSTVKGALEPEALWDGDLPGSLGYQAQALGVMIDVMRFISLVSISLLHPCEHRLNDI